MPSLKFEHIAARQIHRALSHGHSCLHQLPDCRHKMGQWPQVPPREEDLSDPGCEPCFTKAGAGMLSPGLDSFEEAGSERHGVNQEVSHHNRVSPGRRCDLNVPGHGAKGLLMRAATLEPSAAAWLASCNPCTLQISTVYMSPVPHAFRRNWSSIPPHAPSVAAAAPVARLRAFSLPETTQRSCKVGGFPVNRCFRIARRS